MPAGKRDEKLREDQMNKSLSWQRHNKTHATVEKTGGRSLKGDLKPTAILAGIPATPFLFWLAVIDSIRTVVGKGAR